jgi:hypothetical protein
MNKRKFFSVVSTFTIVISLVLFAVVLVKGQETGAGTTDQKVGTEARDTSTQPTDTGTQVEVNEIKIPELNLLRIQNLNFRFQLLVTQRTQIDQELQKIQVEVFAELSNVRKSLDADPENWNVDLAKGVFVRKPKPEEKKKE